MSVAARIAASVDPSRASLRVLLVDDDEQLCFAIEDLLALGLGMGSHRPLMLHSAGTYEEGLALLMCGDFDAALVDYRLGGASGLDLMNEARARGCEVPMIVLTGSGDRDVEVAAMRGEASDYLVKGQFDGRMLERTIRFAVRKAQVEAELRARVRQQLAVADFGHRALSATDLSALTAEVTVLCARLLRVPYALFLEYLPSDNVLVARQGVGWRDGVREQMRIAAGLESQAGYTLLLEAPVVVEDLLHETRFRAHPYALSHGIQSAVTVVVRGGGERAVGVLGVYSPVPRGFTNDDVHFIQSLGNVLAAAIVRERADTARREMQARLLIADRMASVGTLAAGVAHELNNPLAYVIANLTFIAEALDQPDAANEIALATAEPSSEIRQALREAREGAERMRQIVRDLKTFSRSDEESRELVDIRGVLESSINMAWNEIRHRAELVRSYEAVALVDANPSRLGQVFLNLLVNAAQAIPEGHVADNRIEVAVRQRDGFVEIDVSDTGVGISPEVVNRIFDPFFTTKDVGVGTGLGLSICHSIVSSIGGRITVERGDRRGTRFRVELPASARSVAVPRVAEPRPQEGRRGRILVVDDEPTIGIALRRGLAQQHEVIPVSRAQEALERIAQGESFDVIICDLMMPEMTGGELHAELARVAPAMAARMVFLTGGAFSPGARSFLDEVPNERLEKPFDLNQLRALLRRVMD